MTDPLRRFAWLDAMELTPVWRLRSRWLISDRSAQTQTDAQTNPQGVTIDTDRSAPRYPCQQTQRQASRQQTPPQAPPEPPSSRSPERAEQIATMDWEALEAAIRHCQACPLSRERTQAVSGVGDRRARWLFVGEGPGREEDRQGEPFVGPAGKLLDEMLFALGLRRGADVYIANAVKCRPPLNRTPHPEEIAACNPFLARQIALLAPRIIVALGKPAAFALLDEEVKIAQARGRRFDYHGIPVVVTYHPAYLLRNPADKRKAWEDLLFARRILMQQV